MDSKRSLQFAVLLMATGMASAARGEVFVLDNGGRVSGEWVNRHEKPRQNYVVRLKGGGRVTLSSFQVQEVLPEEPELAEYEKIRPRYPDTVAGQWALAEWCRENRLLQRTRQSGQIPMALLKTHARS